MLSSIDNIGIIMYNKSRVPRIVFLFGQVQAVELFEGRCYTTLPSQESMPSRE